MTTVYVAKSAAGDVLYVGITNRPAGRLQAHSRSLRDWGQVATVELEHCDTRDEALRRERELIAEHRPPLNNAGLPISGAAVRAAREAAGLTRTGLAARTDLSLRAIDNIEEGRVTTPYRSTQTLLALALGVDPSTLSVEQAA